MAEVEALQASPEAAPVEPAPEAVESSDAAGEAVEPKETPAAVLDHKRKYEELEAEEKAPEEPGVSEAPAPEVAAPASAVDRADGEDSVGDAEKKVEEPATGEVEDGATAGDAKRQRLDGETEDGGQEALNLDTTLGNGQNPAAESFQPTSADKDQESVAAVPQQSGDVFEQQPTVDDGGQQALNLDTTHGNGQIPATESFEPTSADKDQESVAAGPQQSGFQLGNGQIPATESFQPTSADKDQESVATGPQLSGDDFEQQPTVEGFKDQESVATGPQQSGDDFEQQPTVEGFTTSRKMEVPNNKVGVLIGKSGETIRFLQFNSGAKIQITRDAEADPNSSTRTVELIGTVESVNKAEKLIKDVIAEADAGGSPSLVARGFGLAQPGAEQLQIQVPNEKIGLIIGKGGETIKNLQTRSGARIQLVPQHLPEGGISKERTVRITGNMKQIEAATEMIKEVMSQVHSRPSSVSGGYTQQAYRPRGPTPQWGPRAVPSRHQTSGYGYQQSGTYHSQPYHGYPPQGPRGSFGWDQRAGAPVQTPPQMGGYDYYGQGGGHPSDVQTSGPGPTPVAGGAPNAPVNYYGQPQAPGYGQPASYPQSTPAQQSYGQGYDEPKYDNQQVYGQQPGPGGYSHMSTAPQSGYAQQQPYNKPPYGVPQGQQPQSYGPARTGQLGETTYQGPPQAYGSTGPTQQAYPYGGSSTATPQQASGYTQQTYGMPTPAGTDGYAQQTANYPHQGGQPAPMYGQAAPSYPQGAQTGGYGQYPSSQPGYGEQPVAANASYGYQGPVADAGYGTNVAPAAYAAPSAASGQAGYAQAPSNPSGYEQAMTAQSGYGTAPAGTPVAYAQGATPQQPGTGQYDANMMYAHH